MTRVGSLRHREKNLQIVQPSQSPAKIVFVQYHGKIKNVLQLKLTYRLD
jgi:hypothetical protein